MSKLVCLICKNMTDDAHRSACAVCGARMETPFDGLPSWPGISSMVPGARSSMMADDDEDDDEDDGKFADKPTSKKGKRDDDEDDDDRPRKKDKAKGGMGIGMILGIVFGVLTCCI